MMTTESQIRSFIESIVSTEDPSKAWKGKDCQKQFKELMKGMPKPKKTKHPDEPKGKRSSYILFGQDVRANVVKENPRFSLGEIGKEIGRLWSEMGADERSEYEERAEEDKQRYEREYAEFIESHPEVAEAKKSKKASTKIVGPRKAFQIFSKERRPDIKKKMSDDDGEVPSESDLKKRIKEVFDNLDPDEREEYDRFAEEDKLRYEREKGERGEPVEPKPAKKPNVRKAKDAKKSSKKPAAKPKAGDSESSLMSMKRDELVERAEELGVDAAGLKKAQLVEAIIKSQLGNTSGSDEPDSEASDSELEMDEEILSKLTVAKLKAIAKKNGVALKSKAKKEDIVDAILSRNDSDEEVRGTGLAAFCNENRSRMVEENPDMSPAEVTEALVAEYRAQSAEE
jgi:structure-specific recognition protein 1